MQVARILDEAAREMCDPVIQAGASRRVLGAQDHFCPSDGFETSAVPFVDANIPAWNKVMSMSPFIARDATCDRA